MAALTIAASVMCDLVEALANISAGEGIAFVNRGYARALAGYDPRDGSTHVWSFLKSRASLCLIEGQWEYNLPSDYDGLVTPFIYEKPGSVKASGTSASISDTTLTKTGESFTSTVVAGDTVTLSSVTGDTVADDYTVSSVDSDTQLTLTSAPGDGTASYSITAASTFQPKKIEPATVEEILEFRADSTTGGIPDRYALEALSAAPTTYRVLLHPPPSSTVNGNRLNYQYRPDVTALTDDNVYPLGRATFHHAVQEAALANTERFQGLSPGPHEALYRELIASAIDQDRLLSLDGSKAESISDEGDGMGRFA